MTIQPQVLNTATFVGIDAHPDSHTAVAINRFKEMKGNVTFPNTKGGITRFHNRDGYVRYVGIAPLARSSGKMKKFVNTTRGNRKLNSIFYFAVLDRIIWDKEVKEKYQNKIASEKTKQEAILFLVRKTALLVYGMLKSEKPYRP